MTSSSFKKISVVFLFTAFVFIFSVESAVARVDDGFMKSKKIKTQYFTIFLERNIDVDLLALNLSVPHSLQAIISEPLFFDNPYSLEAQFDMLFLVVSELMDLSLPDFHVDVKICTDSYRMENITKKLFGKRRNVPGFYLEHNNTIYVNASDISIHIFGHELSHALQCNYFVVKPPEKLQEVLAGYVEYQFRKYTNDLPL